LFFFFSICDLFLKLGLKFLALFAFGIKLSIGILLLSLQSLGFLFDLALKFFSVHLDSVFITLDGPLKLSVQVHSLLLRKLDLLLIECPFTLKVNFSLRELILFLINFGFQLLVTLLQIGSFLDGLVFHTKKLFVALCNLRCQSLLLVF
jgi:hypothetical protein